MKEVTLIRHGQSVSNVTGHWQGQGDSPLSDHGREQAKKLAKRVAPWRFDRVLSSDLSRAHDTGKAAAAEWGTAPETDPRWREIDVGAWEGLTREEVRLTFPEQVERLSSGEAIPLGGGESWIDLSRRGVAALRDLVASLEDGQRAVVFAHGGIISMTIVGLFGLPLRKPRLFGNIANTAVTTLRFETPQTPQLVRFNDTLHLGPEPPWGVARREAGAALVELVARDDGADALGPVVIEAATSHASRSLSVRSDAEAIRGLADEVVARPGTFATPSGATFVVSSERGQTLAAYGCAY